MVWLVAIIASVALVGDQPAMRVAIQIAAAAASYFTTNPQTRFDSNKFTWSPIVEVAALFVGIFLTMIPALAYMREHATALPLNEYTCSASPERSPHCWTTHLPT